MKGHEVIRRDQGDADYNRLKFIISLGDQIIKCTENDPNTTIVDDLNNYLSLLREKARIFFEKREDDKFLAAYNIIKKTIVQYVATKRARDNRDYSRLPILQAQTYNLLEEDIKTLEQPRG